MLLPLSHSCLKLNKTSSKEYLKQIWLCFSMELLTLNNINNIKVFYPLTGSFSQDFNSILYQQIASNCQRKDKPCSYTEIFLETNGLLMKGQCKLLLCHNGLDTAVSIVFTSLLGKRLMICLLIKKRVLFYCNLVNFNSLELKYCLMIFVNRKSYYVENAL